MRDWLFSDMGFLFFAAWSAMVAAISYAAFGRDLQPSKAPSHSPTDSSRVSSREAGAH